mgnify:CR=1 FL=1
MQPPATSIYAFHAPVEHVDAPPTLPRGGLNCTMNVTAAHSSYPLKCMLTPNVRGNAGCYAPISVVAPEGSEVVTVEYKINFLGSYKGGELRATGRVVKGGKRIIVTTAEVVHVDDEGRTSPCAVMQQTLVPVPKNY